jgi:hypothetical protein
LETGEPQLGLDTTAQSPHLGRVVRRATEHETIVDRRPSEAFLGGAHQRDASAPEGKHISVTPGVGDGQVLGRRRHCPETREDSGVPSLMPHTAAERDEIPRDEVRTLRPHLSTSAQVTQCFDDLMIRRSDSPASTTAPIWNPRFGPSSGRRRERPVRSIVVSISAPGHRAAAPANRSGPNVRHERSSLVSRGRRRPVSCALRRLEPGKPEQVGQRIPPVVVSPIHRAGGSARAPLTRSCDGGRVAETGVWVRPPPPWGTDVLWSPPFRGKIGSGLGLVVQWVPDGDGVGGTRWTWVRRRSAS